MTAELMLARCQCVCGRARSSPARVVYNRGAWLQLPGPL